MTTLQKPDITATVHKIYYELIKNKELNLSLMSGTPGVALFLQNYSCLFHSAEAARLSEKLSDKIIRKLNRVDSLTQTYSDGLVGVLAFVDFMAHSNQKYEGIIDPSLDQHIASIMISDFKSENYDFMHGAVGAMNYFLNRLNCNCTEMHKAQIFDIIKIGLDYIEGLKQESNRGAFWHYLILDNPEIDNKLCANLGFAHGTPGILALLSDMALLGIESNRIIPMISQSAEFVMSTRRSSALSQFPHYFSDEVEMAYKTPLAWCYGDLGVSISLLKAGKALSNEAIWNEAIDIALKTCDRKSLRETSIHDAGFCHGTSGVVYLYDRIFRLTGNDKFKESRDYWLSKTIEYSHFNNNAIAGFRMYVGDGYWDKSIGMLTGIAGIGLVLMSQIDGSADWNRFFMLGHI